MKLIEVGDDYSDDSMFDEDIIDIFVDESAEVIDEVRTYFPQWKADFDDKMALDEIRRAYHTLKGSANMVRARVIAELSSAVEDVLNKVIDGTATPDNAVVRLIDQSMESIPGMVDYFKQNRAERRPPNIVKQIELAQAILKGEHVDVKPLEANSSTIMRQDDDLIANIPLADSLIVMDTGLDSKPVINKVKSNEADALDGFVDKPKASPAVDLAKFEKLDRQVNGHQLVIDKLEAQLAKAQQQLNTAVKQFEQSGGEKGQYATKQDLEAFKTHFVSLAKEVKDLKYFMSGTSSQIMQEVNHENEKQLKKVSAVLKKAQKRNDDIDQTIKGIARKQVVMTIVAGALGIISGLAGAFLASNLF